MEIFTFGNSVAVTALLISLVTLIWNIVRDFWQDRISVDLVLEFGTYENERKYFMSAGTRRDQNYAEIYMLFSVTNTGRRAVCIKGLELRRFRPTSEGYLESSIFIEGLPKMLQPYEVFSVPKRVPANNELFKLINQNSLKTIWLYDTKGNKWKIGRKNFSRLKKTVKVIANSK